MLYGRLIVSEMFRRKGNLLSACSEVEGTVSRTILRSLRKGSEGS